MECFKLLFDHLAWIEHQFLSGIRDSRKAGSLWGMMRGVGEVRKSIHQSWLAKRLGLGLLYWGFKGVQEEITSEEASTLHLGSVAFPTRQYTSPQHHPRYRLIDQVQIFLPVTFGYSRSSQAVVMWKLRRWKRPDQGHWHAHTRGLPWNLPEVVGTLQKVHYSRSRLFQRGLEFHMCTINKSAHTKKVWKLI